MTTINIDALASSIPPPRRRRRTSRTPEIEGAILGLARRNFSLVDIAGAVGVPEGTLKGWVRRPGEWPDRLRAAVEEGRALEREIARQRYLAQSRDVQALVRAMALRAA